MPWCVESGGVRPSGTLTCGVTGRSGLSSPGAMRVSIPCPAVSGFGVGLPLYGAEGAGPTLIGVVSATAGGGLLTAAAAGALAALLAGALGAALFVGLLAVGAGAAVPLPVWAHALEAQIASTKPASRE